MSGQLRLFLSCCIGVLVIADSTSADLIGRWDFEGVVGASVPDQSGHGLNGTIVDGVGGHLPGTSTPNDTSAAVVYDAARGSNVLDLHNPAPYTDSSEACCGSYVQVSDNPLLDITGDLTIAMWVSNYGSYWFETALIGKGWDYGIIEYAGANKFTSVFIGNSANQRYWMEPAADVSNYGVNEWHHVALTFSAATGARKLYMDGVLEQTDVLYPAGTTLANTGRDLLIGSSLASPGYASAVGRSWNGKIDDVRIYNDALSDAQVRALASVPEPTTSQILTTFFAAAAIGLVCRSRKSAVVWRTQVKVARVER